MHRAWPMHEAKKTCDCSGICGGEKMKRQHWEMKEEILDALDSFPHNLSQITKRLGTNRETAKRHLEELESYGKVRESTEWVNGNKKTVWRLNS